MLFYHIIFAKADEGLLGESPLKKAVSFHGVPAPQAFDQEGDSSTLASPSIEAKADTAKKVMVADASAQSCTAKEDKRPTNSASGQRDPSIILTYLKKNKYDDTGIQISPRLCPLNIY